MQKKARAVGFITSRSRSATSKRALAFYGRLFEFTRAAKERMTWPSSPWHFPPFLALQKGRRQAPDDGGIRAGRR